MAPGQIDELQTVPLRFASFAAVAEVSTRRDEAATRPRTRTMAASKTELRSRAKGKADAKAKDADAEDTKKDAVAGKTDAQGNLMDAAYYFKQYFGLALSIVAFGMVCFAGYAPKYGLSVNLFLYSSESRVPRVSVSRSNRPQRVSAWLYARASPPVSPRECSSCRLQRDILTLFVVAFPAFLLFAGVVFGCVGLIFHETRPFKNQSTFAMDRETVEFARAQEAEAKIQADRAAKKKA